MNKHDIVRAWKDPIFRQQLGADAQAQVPAHPAAVQELDDIEALQASGGMTRETYTETWRCSACCNN